ncbi:hypothetical protein J7438_13155 [Thalassotalea sp. G20_0]|uniref:hypothetical protein n=1 Tax=Thalassotalea sp. G20_0 TaxID=2821093 RepID=UPI001ADB0F61|nr:hypothetical protein [Thalassotalea sp. G20_0]MBO9495027.1 hypothetical protein [Thalassotalea sp. G20_0]
MNSLPERTVCASAILLTSLGALGPEAQLRYQVSGLQCKFEIRRALGFATIFLILISKGLGFKGSDRTWIFEVVTSTNLVARLNSEVLFRLYAIEAIDVFFGRLSKLAWFHN